VNMAFVDLNQLGANVATNIGIDLQAAAIAHRKAAEQQRRPSVILRPRVFLDGDAWCCLLGANIQEGVCGFGATPEEACAAFDRTWRMGNDKVKVSKEASP